MALLAESYGFLSVIVATAPFTALAAVAGHILVGLVGEAIDLPGGNEALKMRIIDQG